MATYSFLNFAGNITGPGGSINFGNGAGPSEEGLSVTMTEDKSTMTIGADGSGMHSLHAGRSGQITMRLLKTSPTNALLMEMYNFQTQSAANHGRNVISARDTARGDVINAVEVAFVKAPDISYAKDGGTIEWRFAAIKIDHKLGSGTPSVL